MAHIKVGHLYRQRHPHQEVSIGSNGIISYCTYATEASPVFLDLLKKVPPMPENCTSLNFPNAHRANCPPQKEIYAASAFSSYK